MLNTFRSIADIATGATRRVSDEHQAFLDFFRSLVETVPPDIAAMFGNLKVTAVKDGKTTEGWGIELTASDYLWWKQAIAEGARFSVAHGGVKSVPRAMAVRLAKKAEGAGLTLDERKSLVGLLDGLE